MSAAALAAAIEAAQMLDLNEALSLKTILDQKIKGAQRPLSRGDIMVYTGRNDNKFQLAQNHTRLVVLEMRRTRCLVQHEAAVGAKFGDANYRQAFLCSPEILAPTGERKADTPAPIKRRRRRYSPEF